MEIRIIEREGLPEAIEAVTQTFFSGNRAEVERHFEGHAEGNSSTLLGYDNGELVGILTIRWDCRYPPFRAVGIPFIHYIEIKWERRGQGLGNQLMEYAERFAAQRVGRIGICVGIFDAYGPAQRLYIKRGFVPDGRGVCQGHRPLHEGETVVVDHDLLLWLVKDLSA
ncbi:MAG TPA: GNAT family N-acetyltransferase [Chthonomonadaceae bacterium]|nr:GNAT family N-acetyltransferase [Chthonomonadaceae bacterium]